MALKLKKKYVQWKELDRVDKKIIKPFAFVTRFIVNRVINKCARIKANAEYEQGAILNLWKPAKSTKKKYSLKHILF